VLVVQQQEGMRVLRLHLKAAKDLLFLLQENRQEKLPHLLLLLTLSKVVSGLLNEVDSCSMPSLLSSYSKADFGRQSLNM
jgi:hypothetical protein